MLLLKTQTQIIIFVVCVVDVFVVFVFVCNVRARMCAIDACVQWLLGVR